ncbi:hypothetical protein C8J56DRAFT_1050810 [Mycena floridula]|nr:hypothetical protein C8J56DRAFT_1050810 [Mycena floridula]
MGGNRNWFISIVLALIVALAIDAARTNLNSEFEVDLARRWGTGQYRIDNKAQASYHTQIRCSRQDFQIQSRHGQPQKANAEGCPKCRFMLDPCTLIL